MRILITLLIFIVLTAPAKGGDFTRVDSVMNMIPQNSNKTVDAIAEYINSKFDNNVDKLRAGYYWLANNISYDVQNMYTGITYSELNQVWEKTLKSKKTVCFGYVETYRAIMQRCGINIRSVHGFVKINDQVWEKLPHSWSAVKIGENWLLIDPTWGAGYLDGNIYRKKLNNNWFMVSPDKFNQTHMPFDPMWTFSYYPKNYSEFASGTPADSTQGRYFNFNDSISYYDSLPETVQLETENSHINQAGVNKHAQLRVKQNNDKINYLLLTSQVDMFNKAAAASNEAVGLFNEFVNYKNGKSKISDTDGGNKLEQAKQKNNDANVYLSQINSTSPDLKKNIVMLKKSISDLNAAIDKFSK